jgi:HSP20 family protein
MTTLTRWDPFREMLTLRTAMDQLFENSFRSFGSSLPGSENFSVPLDIAEDADRFMVTATVPGVQPGNLDITLTENLLTISGEVQPEQQNQSQLRYYLRERPYGKFNRQVWLPAPVQADNIEAHHDQGVVTIYLPKSEEAKPKRISVQSNGHKMIEGQAA